MNYHLCVSGAPAHRAHVADNSPRGTCAGATGSRPSCGTMRSGRCCAGDVSSRAWRRAVCVRVRVCACVVHMLDRVPAEVCHSIARSALSVNVAVSECMAPTLGWPCALRAHSHASRCTPTVTTLVRRSACWQRMHHGRLMNEAAWRTGGMGEHTTKEQLGVTVSNQGCGRVREEAKTADKQNGCRTRRKKERQMQRRGRGRTHTTSRGAAGRVQPLRHWQIRAQPSSVGDKNIAQSRASAASAGRQHRRGSPGDRHAPRQQCRRLQTRADATTLGQGR